MQKKVFFNTGSELPAQTVENEVKIAFKVNVSAKENFPADWKCDIAHTSEKYVDRV